MNASTASETFQAMPSDVDSPQYQQNMQRAFLQSAMVQNLQIQQQLLAQNQALQTLLSQQETTSPTHTQTTSTSHSSSTQIQKSSPKKQNSKTRISSSPFSEMDRQHFRKGSSESNVTPPIPPPMPPPLEFKDPSEARPFLDPYGRAKTVRRYIIFSLKSLLSLPSIYCFFIQITVNNHFDITGSNWQVEMASTARQ